MLVYPPEIADLSSVSIQPPVNKLEVLWSQLRDQSSSTGLAINQPSRLDHMKDAVCGELDLLHSQSPFKKVGILSFAGKTQIFTAGMTSPTIVSMEEARLQTLQNAVAAAGRLALPPSPWTDVLLARAELQEHVRALGFHGWTALGACLAVALGIVESRAPNGPVHEIYLCTDGESNTGIGNVEATGDLNHGRTFYERAGELAASLNTKINVIGISGDGVALDVISAAAEASGGLSTIVDAHQLRRGLHQASRKRVVSKDVTISLRIQAGWHFIPDASADSAISEDGRVLTYTRAQADDSTCVSFAFDSDPVCGPALNADSESVTVQAQMTWTTGAGERVARVLQLTLPTSTSAGAAARQVKPAVVTMHVLQQIGHRMRQSLFAGEAHWSESQEAAGDSRLQLVSLARTISQTTWNADKREEAVICASAIEEFDLLLGSDFHTGTSFPQGLARDNLFQALDRFASISLDDLGPASRKTARILRANELI
jgi:hypothetical protein